MEMRSVRGEGKEGDMEEMKGRKGQLLRAQNKRQNNEPTACRAIILFLNLSYCVKSTTCLSKRIQVKSAPKNYKYFEASHTHTTFLQLVNCVLFNLVLINDTFALYVKCKGQVIHNIDQTSCLQCAKCV